MVICLPCLACGFYFKVKAQVNVFKAIYLWYGVLRDPTLIEDENEAFFIRVWKPLPSRRVLKT